MYINNIFIVYDNGWDWVVYLKSVENVITLGKLIGGVVFILSPPPLYFVFENEEERPRSPRNGNHFSSKSRAQAYRK